MDPDHLERLCADFGLDSDPKAEENHEGVLNRNYVVTTSTGRYFVKSVREKGKPRLPYIAAAEEFFYACGIPAIRMMATSDGRRFAEYGPETYTVYPFIQSVKAHARTDEDFMRMGKLLGRIHAAGSRDVPDALRERVFAGKSPEDVRRTLVEYRERVKDPQDSVEESFLAYIDLKLRMLERTADIPDLPKGTLTHGDYHARNLLVNAERDIIGVIDWEQAAMNARAYELARSVLYACFDGEGESHEYENEQAIRSARAFIDGYSSAYPISRDELAAGMQLRWKHLVCSHWIEEQYFVRNDARSNRFIPHEMRLIEDFAGMSLLNI